MAEDFPNQRRFKTFLYGVCRQFAVFFKVVGGFDGLGLGLQHLNEALAVDFLVEGFQSGIDEFLVDAFLRQMKADLVQPPATLVDFASDKSIGEAFIVNETVVNQVVENILSVFL